MLIQPPDVGSLITPVHSASLLLVPLPASSVDTWPGANLIKKKSAATEIIFSKSTYHLNMVR